MERIVPKSSVYRTAEGVIAITSLTEMIPIYIVFPTGNKHVSYACYLQVSKHVSDHIDFNFSLCIDNMDNTCWKHVWLEIQAAAPEICAAQ